MNIEELITNGQLEYLKNDGDSLAVYQNDTHRWLMLDDVLQSLMLKKHPWQLTMLHHSKITTPFYDIKPYKILECGLGGGNLARFIHFSNADCQLISLEKSSDIIDTFHQYFNPQQTHFNIVNIDVYHYFSSLTENETFDWIISDLFSNSGNLITDDLSLIDAMFSHLNTQGYLSINLPYPTEENLTRLLKKLMTSFDKNIEVVPVTGYQNCIIHAQKS